MPLAMDIRLRARRPMKITTEDAKTQNNHHNAWAWYSWKAKEYTNPQQEKPENDTAETPK
nr:TraF: type-F conjugative transfer system pilin assembly protein [uncultured bacterium]